MRRGPASAVRVLGACARCGAQPDLYDVERHDVPLAIAGGTRVRHELVVCRECRTRRATEPAPMEMHALGLDAASAVDSMEFAQRWRTDLARVQRTARYFLGDARAEHYAAGARAGRARMAEQEDGWKERYRQENAARLFGAVADTQAHPDDSDEDLPW